MSDWHSNLSAFLGQPVGVVEPESYEGLDELARFSVSP